MSNVEGWLAVPQDFDELSSRDGDQKWASTNMMAVIFLSEREVGLVAVLLCLR